MLFRSNLLFALGGSAGLQIWKSAQLLLFVLSNMFFAVLNLLPIKKNDGGSALFFTLSKKHPLERCERICGIISIATKVLLGVIFTAAVLWSGGNRGLIVLFLLLYVPKC